MGGEERELLLGVLALQHRLIDETSLKAAMEAWRGDPSRSLADHLLSGGALDRTSLQAAGSLLQRHLDRHGGDAARGLAAVTMPPWLEERVPASSDGSSRSATFVRSGPEDQPAGGGAGRLPGGSAGAVTSGGERFQVLKPHARGGLGAVFVALDRELNREVALKQILDAHADDASSRRRFLLEAEITGRLEHPGIVPVYGLGVHPDGRPFYAMRFIRGETLEEAILAFHADPRLKADRGPRALALQKLLRRFLDVCNAAEFAHGRGVLHRDIKPKNIIVGSHGETLLVDWGLAKVVGGEEIAGPLDGTVRAPSLSGSTDTVQGSALGTIGFMSPEQARGDLDSLGPATDVYSLGATLACLLTGKAPFQGNFREIMAAVLRGEVPHPRQTDPSIDRALEAVCLKAMAFQAGDRYASARALADDVERWLADEPVTAFRDSLLTRLTRWARRHRTAAASAGMLLTTAVVALSIGTVLLNRERARTEESFRQARAAVDDYFTTVSESRLLDVPGLQPLRQELLNAAAKYYRDFLREHRADPAVRKDAADASFRLAWVTRMIGRPADALEPAETARALYEDLSRTHPAEPPYRQFLARSHGLIGMLKSGTGHLEEGVEQHLKALAIREALAQERPDDPIVRNDVVRTHSNIASDLRVLGRPEESLAEYETAARLGRELLAMPIDPDARASELTGQKGPWPIVHYEVALLNRKRAATLRELGRLDEAEKAWRESLALFEELVARFPDEMDHHEQLAECHLEAVNVLVAQGRNDEALRSLQRALDIEKGLVARNPAVPSYRGGLGRTQVQLASILAASGRNTEALAASREATDTMEQLVSRSPGDLSAQTLLAQSLNRSGTTLGLMGRAQEALPLVVRAQGILEQAVRTEPSSVFYRSSLAATVASVGRVRAALGDRMRAREAFESAAEQTKSYADPYPGQRYNQACYLALMIPVTGPAGREAAAARAMEVLRMALDAGYSELHTLETDSDLDALRGREDFKRLLEDLRKNKAPTP